MTRTLMVVAVLALACGGTDSSSGLECSPSFPAIDGTYSMSIEGKCSGGTLTLAESEIPNSCGHRLTGTWACGALSGETCGFSFRDDRYMELALCDGAQTFWYIGQPPESFAF